MALPVVEISGRMVEDSAFSAGRSMSIYRQPAFNQARRLFSVKTYEILKHLSMGTALTANSLARIAGKHKTVINKGLVRLWQAGMVKQLAVATDYTIFKLWTTADAKLPDSAQEACRMAVLGAFYAMASQEAPDLTWQLIRNNRFKVIGEMTFAGHEGRQKWLIDVPRRGETITEGAQVYIFPTMEEAGKITPKGAYFTSDPYLFKGEQSLKAMLFGAIDQGKYQSVDHGKYH